MTEKTGKVRLFVSDMDGTLMLPDFTISDGNVAALRELEAAGVIFAVATGRIRHDADMICRRCGLKPYIISNNGACVFDPDGKLIQGEGIEPETVKGLVEYLEQEGICYGLGESEHYIASEDWELVLDKEILELLDGGMKIPEEKVIFAKTENTTQHGFCMVKNVSEYLQQGHPVYSISVITYDKEKMQRLREYAKHYGNLQLSVSGMHNMEIVRRDGTKGRSLEILCTYLQIPLEQTAAAGDSMNDLEMLEKAGFAIVMENGMQELKEISDLVTGTNQEDGIADAIRYLLKHL